MPALNHLHTYIRSKTNKNIYRCDHPECSHYDSIDKLQGKKAKCHCGREFLLEKGIRIHFRSATPKCDFCRGKQVIENPAADLIMAAVLNEPLSLETVLKEAISLPVQRPLIDPKQDEGAFEFEKDSLIDEND